MSVQGNAGGDDQTTGSLKSTVAPENSAMPKVDRAAAEPGDAEVDRAAAEPGGAEVDCAAGEAADAEVDRAAAEPGGG